MSTRATLTVYAPKTGTVQHFYHHSDGGLWGVGCAIADAIGRRGRRRRYTSVVEFLAELQRGDRLGAYELTEDPWLHGDRQWHYVVIIESNGTAAAWARERERERERFLRTNAWSPRADPGDFRQRVARSLRDMRQMQRRYRAELNRAPKKGG